MSAPRGRVQGFARSVEIEFEEAYVKSSYFSGGFVCVCALLIGGGVGRAQEPAPQAPQTPAQQPGENPAGQQQGPNIKQPPPLPPQPPEKSMAEEGKVSVGIYGWLGRGQPTIDAGPVFGQDFFGNTIKLPQFPPSRLQLQGHPKQIPGFDLTIPAGKHHLIRASYFRATASGDVNSLPGPLILWAGNYTKGELLSTNYKLQNVKISYDFLSWPYPLGSKKFRVKTLWEFQYTTVNSAFDAPLASTVNGPNSASGHKSIYAPAIGLGMAYYFSSNFRFEANGSGFMIPHHWTLGDADGDFAYKIGRIELRVGGQVFHFRTSPKSDYYLRGTLAGALVGLRFYLN